MNATTLPAGLGRRHAARSSEDYVGEMIRRRASSAPLTTEQKVQKMALILSDPQDGIRRIGVGMVGPIQLKLRYEGIVRNVLVEDPTTPGVPVEYDVWDDLGTAYIMSGTDGQVRVTPFEGKRVPINFFRIASYPMVRKEDLIYMRINAVEQAQDESKQAIMKQEDGRLLLLLQAALTTYGSRPDHTVTPNHVVTEVGGYYTPDSLYTAVTISDQHELVSSRLLVSVADYRDFYRWDLLTTGVKYKDAVVEGAQVTTFGEFQIARSIMVTPKTMWLLPQPNFLGVMPILYSLDVEQNHNLPAFWRGWVMDEMISMAILNARGIVKVVKN